MTLNGTDTIRIIDNQLATIVDLSDPDERYYADVCLDARIEAMSRRVGDPGLEPGISCLSDKRSGQLS